MSRRKARVRVRLASAASAKVSAVDHGHGADDRGGSAAGRIAREVATQQATLLERLRAEVGDGAAFAAAAARLAEEYGAVTAAALDALSAASPLSTPSSPRPEGGADGRAGEAAAPGRAGGPAGGARTDKRAAAEPDAAESDAAERGELPSLYRPGHMRRRLEQLLEINRRYGHPFGLAVFDASGPGTRGGSEDVISVLGATLRDSIRIVDEAFLLEEDAICVLAPNLRTVEGMQMAERLLGRLEELERAGGLRVSVAAGVVACPDHGTDADVLLHKADTALWRARAVGQPVGVGELAH